MNRIQYITADLDLKSSQDINVLAQELCGEDSPHLNQWVENEYCVVVGGIGFFEEPENEINDICDRADKLSIESKKLWESCNYKVVNIGFESGEVPNHKSFNLSPKTIERLGKLKLGVEIRLYPINR